MIHIVETEAIDLVRCAVELAQSSCESASIDENERVTRIRAADADGLSSHIVRAHLDALLGRERIGQCSSALPVEIVTGDNRLRFRGFLQHLLIEIYIHMDIVG